MNHFVNLEIVFIFVDIFKGRTLFCEVKQREGFECAQRVPAVLLQDVGTSQYIAAVIWQESGATQTNLAVFRRGIECTQSLRA
jgi:hypothetical protein